MTAPSRSMRTARPGVRPWHSIAGFVAAISALAIPRFAWSQAASASPAPASAQPASTETAGSNADAESREGAGSAYDQGTAAYAAHDYSRAAHWFETADRLAPAETALTASIRANRRVGDPAHNARAATLALRLRARYPQSPRGMVLAAQIIGEVGPSLDRVTVSCGGCQVELDGVFLSFPDFFVLPGHHNLVAHWSESRTVARPLESAPGGTESLAIETPPLPPRAIASAAPPSHSASASPAPEVAVTRVVQPSGLSPAVMVVSLVLTLGAGAVAAWSVVDTYQGASQYNAMPTDAGRIDGHQRELRSDITVAAASVLAAWTLIDAAVLTRWRGPHVEVVPTAQSMNVFLEGRF